MKTEVKHTEPTITKVAIIESEIGWGQRIDSVKSFRSRKSAERFVKKYNDLHNPPMGRAPDWYMIARIMD